MDLKNFQISVHIFPLIIFSDSWEPDQVPKTPLKNPGLTYV